MRSSTRHSGSVRAGFTLVELIIVMVLLTVVLSLAAPSLSRFFRGHTLQAEARRMVSLTRFVREEAISQAIPLELWIDADQRQYGVRPRPGFPNRFDKPLRFDLNPQLRLELGARPVNADPSAPPTVGFRPDGTREPNALPAWEIVDERSGDRMLVRLAEDGRDYVVERPNDAMPRLR